MSAPSGRRASKARPRGSTANVIVEPSNPAGVGAVARGNVEIAPEEIARLAFSYWEARGSQGGSPEEDWLRAERQLRAGNQAARS
jgi:hypothetical protein